MKFNNYIFTGFGMSKGKYKITNDDIFYAIEKEFLSGFSKEKVEKSENSYHLKKIRMPQLSITLQEILWVL